MGKATWKIRAQVGVTSLKRLHTLPQGYRASWETWKVIDQSTSYHGKRFPRGLRDLALGAGHVRAYLYVQFLLFFGRLAVPTAVQTLSDELLKYYQQVTRAILGDDPHLMKVALLDLQSNSKIAALLPYFVYVISGVEAPFFVPSSGLSLSPPTGNERFLSSAPGEVGEPRLGAAQQAPPHGEEPRPEPLPVPGLLRAQPGVQRHVLHPGAAGRVHQPAQRPLDAPGLRRPVAQPHILVSESLCLLKVGGSSESLYRHRLKPIKRKKTAKKNFFLVTLWRRELG